MRKSIRTLAFLAALTLSGFAAQAIPPGWTYSGCWSPYMGCAGAADVYRDSSGTYWQCGPCGTATNPSPSTCYASGNLNRIGYWCS